jgi:hypothetical protein
VALTDRGEDAADRRFGVENGLDLLHDVVGVIEAGAIRRLDVDHELRDAGLGEDREADPRHQQEAAEHHEQRCEERELAPPHDEAEHGAVGTLDQPRHRAKRDVAVLGLSLEHVAGEERDQGQRHEQRREDRHDHGDRHAANELTGVSGEEQQRHEREHQRRRAAEHSDADLPGGLDRRLARALAHAQPARDVLGHHDRIVDQQAERDHEPDDAELVQREPEIAQRGDADRQRHRDRDHHQQRGAQPQRDQRDQDQDDRDEEVALEAAEPMGDVLRLIVGGLERHPGRQPRRRLGRRGGHPIADIEDVLALVHRDRDQRGALSVVAEPVGLRRIDDPCAGHVAQVDEVARAAADHGALELRERGERAAGLHVEPTLAEVDIAPRDAGVATLQCADELSRRQAVASQPCEIELDARLLVWIRLVNDIEDAANALEVPHDPLDLLGYAGAGRVAGQHRELEDRDVAGREVNDVDLFDTLGQLRARGLDLTAQLVLFRLGVDAGAKVDADERDVGHHAGHHPLDLRQLGDLGL